MSKNAKRIFKYAGIGFLVGFGGFWVALLLAFLPGVAEGFGYLIMMPALILAVIILHTNPIGIGWFIISSIIWGILAVIGAEIILAIKLFIKRFS